MDKPTLISSKPLQKPFDMFNSISITNDQFSIGRGLDNNLTIPYLPISRNHCIFKRIDEDWLLEDTSTYGVSVNDCTMGKGKRRKLSNGDIIRFEQSNEFVYIFSHEIPRKRIKLEKLESEGDGDDIISNVKMRFEESQNYERIHMEEKIQNVKNMQETSRVLKEQIQLDMERKIVKLQKECALQIENLKGEKDEVEKQKALLIVERDNQLIRIKNKMEGMISELKDQIQKHHQTESELLKENNILKEKVLKEREEFLAELNRESSSKQDMLDKLNAKIREQDEIRLREKQELEQTLRDETEQLKLAKEKELKQLEEEKQKREKELEEELNVIKKNLEQQIQQAEEEKCKAEKWLTEKLEEQRKLTDEDRVKMEQLIQERQEIEKKLADAQTNADKLVEQVKANVAERETELKALAADRIQKHAEQSSEVITTLQKQLEKVKSQLESVENEKNSMLEGKEGPSEEKSESSSKHATLSAMGELMESELQCSVCAELFVSATTLSCSHTFCKYCITMWKMKKKECPICRAPITSECKSLVLDSFIERMVQNLTDEMKTKRQEILKLRELEVSTLMSRTTPKTPNTTRRYRRRNPARTQSTPTISTGQMQTPHIVIVDLTSLRPMNAPERPPIFPVEVDHRVYQIQDPELVAAGNADTTAGTDTATPAAGEDAGPAAAPSPDQTPR